MDKTLRLWDLRTGDTSFTYRFPHGDVNDIKWFIDDLAFAVASSDGLTRLYDIRTHSMINSYDCDPNGGIKTEPSREHSGESTTTKTLLQPVEQSFVLSTGGLPFFCCLRLGTCL